VLLKEWGYLIKVVDLNVVVGLIVVVGAINVVVGAISVGVGAM